MNYEEWLTHMNPYHDSETGRFTTANGTFLQKGTRLNSVSGQYKNSDEYRKNGRWMYTYRADQKWDNKVYKGPFAYFLRYYRHLRNVREHEFVTTKDLKMPTREERIEEFKKLNRKNLSEDLKSLRDVLANNPYFRDASTRDRFKKLDIDHLKTKQDWSTAYEIFSHLMEASYYYKSTQEYMKRMSGKWDAMVDDNNKSVYNNTVDPIIIFRANEALKKIRHIPIARLIGDKEIRQNLKEIETELKKYGKEVTV